VTPVVALLTDFGRSDTYAAVMKLVIYKRCPGATIVDLTHEIPAGDVRLGAIQLAWAAPYLPPGSIVAAVVDPGVGGDRRGLVIGSGGRWMVGPDNGLLWPAAEQLGKPSAYALDQPEYWLSPVSCTFHGRDVFAPVAAALARGVPVGRLGAPIDDPVELHLPGPIRTASGGAAGEVLSIDRFGNAITNIRLDDLKADDRARFWVSCRGLRLQGPVRCYSAVEPGEALVLVGSAGLVEIAVRDGSAAESADIHPGDRVELEPV